MKWMGRSSYEEDKSVQLNLEPRLVLKSKKGESVQKPILGEEEIQDR